MIKCEINKMAGSIDEKFVKKIVKDIFKILKIQKASISVAIVDKKTIRKLNKKYRKKDEVTDVLSFEELNEIIIEESETKDKKNLKKLLAHSILHLLGHRHGEKMFGLQKKICSKLKEL
ncbi:MAG: rRNA maturation RNase YbeY [Patescibacteria group bacterium]|nr:rRNA maturation RNase YbeY [Patescibacteria group bacterium]